MRGRKERNRGRATIRQNEFPSDCGKRFVQSAQSIQPVLIGSNARLDMLPPTRRAPSARQSPQKTFGERMDDRLMIRQRAAFVSVTSSQKQMNRNDMVRKLFFSIPEVWE